ncbi:hypothetical protein Ahy_A06g030830 [Arachis hypogaea]|uniref:Uncharacterized protein n=1 Tax=Arachis hypogaea TaxID=3818 RepID=A0A445CXK7_ARAHY|nr:hypothetical protein Ahy_A06g030830 [Arachis hypogaea]
MESKFDGTLTTFKAYFLAKEGRIPVELTSIFDHGAQANDVENKIITPTKEEHHQTEAMKIVKTLFSIVLKID